MNQNFVLKGALSGLLLIIISLVSSCRCSCRCELNIGCRIASAVRFSTGDTLQQSRFCSTESLYTDPVVEDSITRFYQRYNTDSTYIYIRDTISFSQRVNGLKCREASFYEQKGYMCNCSK